MSVNLFFDKMYPKPNRVEEKNKDNNPEYHAQYAKYAIGASATTLHNEFVRKAYANKRFYQGKQWDLSEDLEAFLKDDTGQDRNRIIIVNNIIRPMIEQYRGNAIRMVINAKVKAMSKKAVDRRNDLLEEKLFLTDVAQQLGSFLGEAMQREFGVGRDQQETIKIFNNTYIDEYVDKMNKLLTFSKELNNFKGLQMPLAENLGLTGLAVAEAYEHGGHLRFRTQRSEDFFFDRGAEEKDLSDADFMGVVQDMLPSEIFERWQSAWRDDAQRKAIEAYASADNQNTFTDIYHEAKRASGRVPVYRTYWRDVDVYDYGYVEDEFGAPYLAKINFVEPGEEEPKYTEKDLIDPPDTEKDKKIFKGKKTRKLVVDVVRYAYIIPAEIISTRKNGQDRAQDIVLDYGVYEFQETDYMDVSNVKFPFKCQTWAYIDGEISSPVDDAINPQRFINRVMSVIESQVNNSGGTNIVYDKDSVDSQDGEDEIMRNVAQGKPIGLRTKGRGVPNTLGSYNATPNAGTYNMFELVSAMQGLTQGMTGLNEPLQGQSTGPDQLVGVTELLIQRGSLMQEPFYYALSDVFLQMFNFISSVGKNMYIANERELEIATGEDGLEVIKLSKGMANEDFRSFVKRENSDEILMAAANQQLDFFLSQGLITRLQHASLYNRATPEDVTKALKNAAIDEQEAARENARATAQAQEQAAEALENERREALAEQSRLETREDIHRMEDKQQEIDKLVLKNLGDISQQRVKNQGDSPAA